MDPLNSPPVQNNQPYNTNNVPVTPSTMTSSITPPHHQRKVGPILASLVIVLVLIIAALYLFGSQMNKQAAQGSPSSTINSNTNDVATITQSVPAVTNTSDNPQAIQTDLNTATQGVDVQNF